MKTSRRKFAGALVAGAALPALAQSPADNTDAKTDLSMKVIGIPMNEERTRQVREALQNTLHQVQVIRAYPVKRDTEPAISLGIFDS